MLEEVPDLDVVLSPVGGGGLLSGNAVATKGIRPATRVIGVEPEQADDAARSFAAGQLVTASVDTIADGLRTMVGERNFPLIQAHVDQIVVVSEAAIIAAMRRIWEVLKIVVEPSGAVPFAALLERRFTAPGQRIGIILSGGNVDLDRLPWGASPPPTAAMVYERALIFRSDCDLRCSELRPYKSEP